LNKKVLNFGFGIVIIFLILALSSSLYAGISVDPITVETTAEIGKKMAGTWKITNTGKNKMDVITRCEDWFRKGFKPDTWIKIEPGEFSLNAKETKKVKYIVNLPKNVSDEMMAMVFFSGIEKGATVGVSFGIPVYVAVKETAKIDAEIKNCDLKYNYKEKELSGTIYIKDKGNVHIRPIIYLQILDKMGKTVNSFEIPFGQPAQAGQLRPFMFKKKMKLSPAVYKLRITADYGKIYKIKDKIAVKDVMFEVKT